MVVIERSLLLQLTRELRNANGIERTPAQVEKWLNENAIMTMANRMRIPYIENAPPSSDWE